MSQTRIILLDIETAPSLGWVWQKWETNVLDFQTPWYMLSFAWKVFGEKETHVRGLDDYSGYNAGAPCKCCGLIKGDLESRENDKFLLQDLWKVMDEADVILAHNGDAFDIPKINTRFIFHGIKPPSPYETIDTLKLARKVFQFDSNKLDDLGQYLKVGRKVPHTGFHLWRGCMMGDINSWNMMKEYNKGDVELLERVYIEMLPWADNLPSFRIANRGVACEKIGCGSTNVQSRGETRTRTSIKKRYCCSDCGGWFYGPSQRIKGDEVKVHSVSKPEAETELCSVPSLPEQKQRIEKKTKAAKQVHSVREEAKV